MKQRSKLFSELYDVLRRLAERRLVKENCAGDATSLVHDTYLKLRSHQSEYENEQHFLAVASSAMRQILVDRARARGSLKRGGNQNTLSLRLEQSAQAGPSVIDVLLLDELLDRLATFDARGALIAEMRLFLGLDMIETAAALGLSDRTVKRDWSVAKAWLQSEIALRGNAEGPATSR